MEPQKKFRKIIRFLGLRRSIVGILGMVVLVGMGERLGERFLPIYLATLGGSALLIGFYGAVKNFVPALYSYFGGYVSDFLGEKRALLFFNFIAAFGFLIVIVIPAWQAVFVGALFFLAWSAVSLPATMSVVSKVLPMEKRTMGVSMISLLRRVPMAVGPVVGGFCIAYWGSITGIRVAFGIAFVMVCLSVVFQERMIEAHPLRPGKGGHGPEANPLKLFGEMSGSLRNLLVSDILIRFCEQIPDVFVVVWCMEAVAGYTTARVTAPEFGYLSVIEMITAVLCYIPVAYLADRGGKKPFVLMTFVNFSLFPLVLYFSRSLVWLAVAFVVRGLKEFGEPTRKALIMDLAPEHRKAAMFGLYYLIRDTIVSLAAMLGGLLWWGFGPKANLMTAFAFGALGTLWFAWRGRDLAAEKS
ncbi:MAG: MFS transporter [Planctomycetota bacterium]